MNLAGVVRGRLRLLRNALFRRASAGSARHPLLGAALAVLLGALLFGGMRALFAWLAESGTSPDAAGVLLGLALGAGLLGLLVFDLQEAIGVLLLDSDLELLRRAPLRARELFALKLVDAMVRTSSMVMVLLLPALLGFVAGYGAGGWGLALVPLLLAGLWSIPVGLGMALAIAVVSRLPARRAREGLALFTTFGLILVWLANVYVLPRLAGSEEPVPGALTRLMEAPPRLAAALPSAWAARALAAAARRKPAAAAGPVAALLVAGALSMALAGAVAGRGLEAAQARVAGPRPRARRATARAPAAGARARPAGVTAAILARDARLFLRDWTMLSDVLISAALWTLLPFLGLSLPAGRGPLVGGLALLALAVALGYEVAARALPFEREGGAWRRLAPVSAWRWTLAKLAGAALVAAPILLIASLAITLPLRIGPAAWLGAIALALPALGLALVVGLLSGAWFGNPRWTDPRAMLGFTGRLVALLLLVAQVALWVGVWFGAQALGPRLPPGVMFVAPAALAGLLAAAPLGMTARRIAATEWPG
jgi:hypothetical protein